MSRPWRIGCYDGCGDLDECSVSSATPAGSHCPCASLGIDMLSRRSTVRWHLAGHPIDLGVAA